MWEDQLREESDRLGTAHFHLKTVSEATALLAAVEDLLFWQLLADFTENLARNLTARETGLQRRLNCADLAHLLDHIRAKRRAP